MSANLQGFLSSAGEHPGLKQYEDNHEPARSSKEMLQAGISKKVTIHLNEDTASKQDFLYNEIFSFLRERGVAGASLIRPEAGFGSHHQVHRKEFGHAAREHMPVRIEFIDS